MSCMQFNARSYHQGGGAEGKRTEFEVARQEYSESGKEERIGGKWRKEMCSSSCRSVCLLAPAWPEGVPCRLGLASSLGGPMAPPKCSGPCGGTTLTELTSRSLRSTWGAAEVELVLARFEEVTVCLLALLPRLSQACVAGRRAAAKPPQLPYRPPIGTLAYPATRRNSRCESAMQVATE